MWPGDAESGEMEASEEKKGWSSREKEEITAWHKTGETWRTRVSFCSELETYHCIFEGKWVTEMTTQTVWSIRAVKNVNWFISEKSQKLATSKHNHRSDCIHIWIKMIQLLTGHNFSQWLTPCTVLARFNQIILNQLDIKLYKKKT